MLLAIYIAISLVFSFACSVFEAVLLSVNSAYISLMEKRGQPAGALLKSLKADVSKPLAAILTLNTIAHTVGAAGAGAEAAKLFGSAYVGVISAVLTLLILVFSEIIPKTLGATYWRKLAPLTAHCLKYLIIVLYPFVKLSDKITGGISGEPTLNGFSREEFAAMAEISTQAGQLAKQESRLLRSLMKLRNLRVKDAMTPRTVIFSLSEDLTVEEYFHKYDKVNFSRVPIFDGDREKVTGFVFRNDLLLAQARGNGENPLQNYCRELPALIGTTSLLHALNEMLGQRVHIMLVVSEYGGVEGILTLEDVMETMLGFEIVDEKDKAVDMQKEAKRLWRRRAGKKSTAPE
ncbi:hemolysin family protein [Simiduia sp. 21SJ11W-1]|uniref:CNNM domain-containing protein n=1 Tax=Simiduia sp. 21SJ11W-1 TaxID=2909669 RepID=UPI0020A220BD|nr:hemolysin family protein [Simiduia sp. 21SJ11W-1]UTA48488.1 hemolysin family protein [Simiduia sp. 21SJ11W-1]